MDKKAKKQEQIKEWNKKWFVKREYIFCSKSHETTNDSSETRDLNSKLVDAGNDWEEFTIIIQYAKINLVISPAMNPVISSQYTTPKGTSRQRDTGNEQLSHLPPPRPPTLDLTLSLKVKFLLLLIIATLLPLFILATTLKIPTLDRWSAFPSWSTRWCLPFAF